MTAAALSTASRELEYAARAVSDHFELTGTERQSIRDRRYLKKVLTRARDALAPIAEREAAGADVGDNADLLSAYRALSESVLRRLGEASVYDDNRAATSDLVL